MRRLRRNKSDMGNKVATLAGKVIYSERFDSRYRFKPMEAKTDSESKKSRQYASVIGMAAATAAGLSLVVLGPGLTDRHINNSNDLQPSGNNPQEQQKPLYPEWPYQEPQKQQPEDGPPLPS